MNKTKYRMALLAFLSLCLSSLALAQDAKGVEPSQDYLDVPLEELMKVDVTDAFKSPIPLMKVPAAIYTITQDDIRRSGVSTLPEALRLVSGVEVARIGSVYYTISIRGFADYLASNKILVLLDGRTLYSPFQNTVYWEIEDVVMENIDRIEVILGPGGSLWGANAVNGVINVITKNSKDTKGGLLVQSVGDLEKNRSIFQYGNRISDDVTYRVFGKYGVNHATNNLDGTSFGDGNSLNSLGFRADISLPGHSSLMVEGAIAQYRITEDQPIALAAPPYNTNFTNTDHIATRHLLAKWVHDGSEGSQTSIQSYYDLIDYPYTNQGSSAEMVDLSFEQRLARKHRNEIAYGAGYRTMRNRGIAGPSEVLTPESRNDTIFNVFGQDILDLTPIDHLTLGLKLENNNSVGYEIQPNIRYSHTPNADQTLWAAVGKADRTPSQSEQNIFSLTSISPPGGGQPLPVATALIGSPNLKPETVISNEIGFRQRLNDRASFDVATFYNFYNNLIYLAPGAQFTSTLFGPPVVIDPSYFRNGNSGQTYGLEALARYTLAPRLKSDVTFTALERNHFVQGSELAAPHLQASLHLAWDANKKLEVDGRVHWSDAIYEQGVPAHAKLDLHITWKISDCEEFSFGGYDLLTPHHYEFALGSNINRNFIAEWKWRF